MIARFQGRKLDATETMVLGQIEQYGWNVTNIREQNGALGWTFTIGLFETFKHPEVLIFGLRPQTRNSILNWIGENVRNGRRFSAGEEHDWVAEGYNSFSREVHPNWYPELVGWATWFYDGPKFELVQCLWPSRMGQYPWQDEHAEQPLLYEADLVAARMMHYASDKLLLRTAWPFDEDPNTGVYVSRCVMEDGAPIVEVAHDSDGDWQFIGPVEDPEADGIKLVCLRHLIDQHPSLRVHARLHVGWQASRNWDGERFRKSIVMGRPDRATRTRLEESRLERGSCESKASRQIGAARYEDCCVGGRRSHAAGGRSSARVGPEPQRTNRRSVARVSAKAM